MCSIDNFFCEFDYVRLPNTIERLVFDFVRLLNVRVNNAHNEIIPLTLTFHQHNHAGNIILKNFKLQTAGPATQAETDINSADFIDFKGDKNVGNFLAEGVLKPDDGSTWYF